MTENTPARTLSDHRVRVRAAFAVVNALDVAIHYVPTRWEWLWRPLVRLYGAAANWSEDMAAR